MASEKTIDKTAKPLIDKAKRDDVELVWDRFEKQGDKCNFGELGICCKNCNMGPCRLTHPSLPIYLRVGPHAAKANKGVCGAGYDTLVARNLARAIAAGAAAHSDHSRDIAHTLLLTAENKASGYEIKDEGKLKALAAEFGIETTGKDKNVIAKELALAVLDEFGMVKGKLQFVERAPEVRQKLWKDLGIIPRGVDREIVEMMHRTHIGVDNDYANLILHGLRTSLSDGWGGSMIATELSDVLFGTPKPVTSRVNLGVLNEKEVNIVVHGHEPILSEMLAEAVNDPEHVELAKMEGATGINLCGMCCTANELLMRRGIPVAGNFLNQELAIVTGAVEAMVVDVQCIMPSLGEVAKGYHTLLISTSPKAKFPHAEHIEFDEENGFDIAKGIVERAILNFKNRNPMRVLIPSDPVDMMAGFSAEAIIAALGGSLTPLIDAIKEGKIRGIAALVGCNNPKVVQDKNHVEMTKALIKNDILVVETGCSAIACAKAGLLLPDAADMAGEGLKSLCRSLGIPPVLHMGSCVDISRILVVVASIANELGVDISDLPVAAAAPEWMSEKAVSIGTYAVASGIFTLLGLPPAIMGSSNVVELLTAGAEDIVGGKFAVETDPIKAAELIIEVIDDKRKGLGL
ncbi:MAG: anaerobic carbon-monoxide dehydrogenase catalytic subunit [Methanosarcinales archaeon]|nr:anaerobic carbon-monoxide dehydrogenase catalytic subunit [Methanosarcinales archaeon]